MDKLDWKILQVLDWRGREPMNKIAKIIRSNKDVIAYRIKKLEEQNIIVHYYPVLDMGKLGFYTSRLYFDLEEIDEIKESEFISFLDKLGIGVIFRMDYPYRYGILFWTKSVYDVEKILLAIKQKLGSALLRYNYTFFCTDRIYPKDYLFGIKYHHLSYTKAQTDTVDYNYQDFLILKELAKNARSSTVQIAQNVKIPQTTVSSKIKNLEKKKIILGYRAEINFIKLGFINYFLEIYLHDNHNLSQLEGWANVHKNVVWLQKIIGTCDIEIEVEVKDREELESLLNELRVKFKNIRKIIFWSQEYKKLTYLPSS